MEARNLWRQVRQTGTLTAFMSPSVLLQEMGMRTSIPVTTTWWVLIRQLYVSSYIPYSLVCPRIHMSQLHLLVQVPLPLPVPCLWQGCDYFDQWNMAGVMLWEFWGWVLETDEASAWFAASLRAQSGHIRRLTTLKPRYWALEWIRLLNILALGMQVFPAEPWLWWSRDKLSLPCHFPPHQLCKHGIMVVWMSLR